MSGKNSGKLGASGSVSEKNLSKSGAMLTMLVKNLGFAYDNPSRLLYYWIFVITPDLNINTYVVKNNLYKKLGQSFGS